MEQGGEPGLGGAVEGERDEVEHAIVAGEAVAGTDRRGMHGERPVGDGHALGLAGRSGGEDDVGELVGMEGQAGIGGGSGEGVRVVEAQARAGGALARHVGEEEAGAGLADDGVAALRGGVGIDGEVGGAGLEDGEDGDEGVGGSFEAQGDAVFGVDAASDESMGEGIGAGIERGIGEAGRAVDEGDARALAGGQRRHPSVHRFKPRRQRHPVLRGQEGALSLREQRGLAAGRQWTGQQGGQHLDEAGGPTLAGAGQEAGFGQDQRAGDRAAFPLLDSEDEIELGRLQRCRHRLGGEAGEKRRRRHPLVAEHHVERPLARPPKPFQDAVQGKSLFGQPVLQRRGDRLGDLGKGKTGLRLKTQGQGVDEGTDHILRRRSPPIGHGHADADIAQAGAAPEEDRKGGEHQSRRRHAPLRREQPERLLYRGGKDERHPPRPIAVRRSCGQTLGEDDARSIGQTLAGARQRLRVVAGFLADRLPGCPIGKAQGRHRNHRLPPGMAGGVVFGDLPGQDAEGPRIADSVMHREDQGMPVGSEADQGDPHQRAGDQVEGPLDHFAKMRAQSRLSLGAGQVVLRQRTRYRRVDDLEQVAVLCLPEAGA
ncbi:hypothetical protein BGCPKDLD_5252 [Methylorubrum suomiense]|uniref:Uncharacterized protein n=1 Tax=Methylorubrum suomiense TaxID=144191 RepID=A0ABQ4V3S3_9HYPH|nr:hypothetical protein BGCPKDLD_5252 [Methylorubrum suomiense]